MRLWLWHIHPFLGDIFFDNLISKMANLGASIFGGLLPLLLVECRQLVLGNYVCSDFMNTHDFLYRFFPRCTLSGKVLKQRFCSFCSSMHGEQFIKILSLAKWQSMHCTTAKVEEPWRNMWTRRDLIWKKFGFCTTRTLSHTPLLLSENFWKKEKWKFSRTPCTVPNLPHAIFGFLEPYNGNCAIDTFRRMSNRWLW